MQVHCDEGIANHIGPEPCAGLREESGEALAGESIGQPLSHESHLSWVLTLLIKRKATRPSALSRVRGWPGVVEDPGMCGRSLCGNREISCLATGKQPSGPHREGEEP